VQHRQRDRHGEEEDQLEQRYPQGVDDRVPEGRVGEDRVEVGQADPLAGPQPVEGHVVLERDDVSGQRAVLEDQEVDQPRGHQQQQNEVPPQPLTARAAASRTGTCSCTGRARRSLAAGGVPFGNRHRVLLDA